MSAKAAISVKVEPKVESKTKVAKASVVEVKEKSFFMVVYRQRHEDPWTIKGFGQEPFREKQMAEDSIPPVATEAMIVEFKLPI